MPTALEPTTIRQGANRRLYNSNAGACVAADHLTMMLDDDVDFVVSEAGSGEDVTRLVFKQITVQRGNHG